MNVKEINLALASGAVESPSVLPRLAALKKSPFVFGFEFGLQKLPEEPGIILVRGPRQFGKSTWLEQQIHATVTTFGPGSAFYINGDEVADDSELSVRIRELAAAFDPRRPVRRLFIDEITAIRNWQRSLKRLADAGELERILVITTGSQAIDLRRGAERLPGRKGRLPRTSYYFTPIAFGEFQRVCGEVLGASLVSAYILSGGSPVACAELAGEGRIPEHLVEATRDWIYGECAAAGRSRISLHAVMEALHRHGGTPIGQAKLARESGLANNTVAAGYIELLSDLMCVSVCFAWDPSRRVRLSRKPCKFHFTNLLSAAAWGGEGLRSPADFDRLAPEVQGKWLEWLVAQELRRQDCIQGKDFPDTQTFWHSRDREIDFVVEPGLFIEVKRGVTDPFEYSWFTGTFPDSRLLVIGRNRFEARGIRGITLEEFLLGGG